MSTADQAPADPFLRFAEECQLAIWHLTGDTSMPSRWGALLIVALAAVAVALYAWMAVCHLGPDRRSAVRGAWPATPDPHAHALADRQPLPAHTPDTTHPGKAA